MAEENGESEEALPRRTSTNTADLTSLYVDTWAIGSWKGHVRIVMGEEIGRKDCYRFAYVMEVDDAEFFAKHLLERIKIRREKDLETKERRIETEGQE